MLPKQAWLLSFLSPSKDLDKFFCTLKNVFPLFPIWIKKKEEISVGPTGLNQSSQKQRKCQHLLWKMQLSIFTGADVKYLPSFMSGFFKKRVKDNNARPCCLSISTAHHGRQLCSPSRWPHPFSFTQSLSLSLIDTITPNKYHIEMRWKATVNAAHLCSVSRNPNLTWWKCVLESHASIMACLPLLPPPLPHLSDSALNRYKRGGKQDWWRVCVWRNVA